MSFGDFKSYFLDAGFTERDISAMGKIESEALLRQIIESKGENVDLVMKNDQAKNVGSRLKSDAEIIVERNLATIESLNDYRKQLVSSLIFDETPDRFKYNQKAHQLAKTIPQEPNNGVTVSVVLVDGQRITRKFDPQNSFETVYIWAATQEKMMKDQVKLGSFVLISKNGNEINPIAQVSSLGVNRVVMFMRVF